MNPPTRFFPRAAVLALLLTFLSSAAALAQDDAHLSMPLDRPVLPADPSNWAGTMLIVIIAMFVMAAVIGPIVRAEMPQAGPVSHGHHEPVGHDEHGHHVEHDSH